MDERQNSKARVDNFRYSNALDEIEGILIEIIEPKLNKRGGNLPGMTEYFQYIDAQVEDVTNHELKASLARIENMLSK